MKTALALRHVATEDLGQLAPLLTAGGYQIRYFDVGVESFIDVSPLDAELVIVSGSSSVGPADHLEKCLHDLGAQPVVRAVACAPGRTQSLWRLPDGRLLVGLPGNPLAAIVAYLTLVDAVCAGLLGTPLPTAATVGACEPESPPAWRAAGWRSSTYASFFCALGG